MKREKEVLAVFNGVSFNGVSGGEIHGILLARYLSSLKNRFRIAILAPEMTYQDYFDDQTEILSYPRLPGEKILRRNNYSLFLIYCYRIIASIFVIRRLKPDIIICSSHLFHDTIPTYFINNKNITFITYLHHIISEQKRKGLSFLIVKFLERLSFFVIQKKNAIIFTDSNRNKVFLNNKYGFHKKTFMLLKME